MDEFTLGTVLAADQEDGDRFTEMPEAYIDLGTKHCRKIAVFGDDAEAIARRIVDMLNSQQEG